MKVCAVLVTYGDRYRFLKQGIEALIDQQITQIIVIDNHSAPSSHKQLKAKEKALNGKLKVIHLLENSGSAGGYYTGLKYASQCRNCEFIWLLDDDNKPKEGALKALTRFWQDLMEEDKADRISLMSYRENRDIYKDVILKSKPDLVIGRKNSSFGFHLCGFPAEMLRRFKKICFPKISSEKFCYRRYGSVSAVPFGGMFFHKDLLKNIGYPSQKLYLYSDDWDFSYRITKKGGKIFLLLDSVIEDLEESWHQKQKKGLFKVHLLQDLENSRLYYYVRNRVYFERKYLVTNPVIYFLNKFVLLSIVALFGLIKKRECLNIIREAVRDGNRERLGRSFESKFE